MADDDYGMRLLGETGAGTSAPVEDCQVSKASGKRWDGVHINYLFKSSANLDNPEFALTDLLYIGETVDTLTQGTQLSYLSKDCNS